MRRFFCAPVDRVVTVYRRNVAGLRRSHRTRSRALKVECYHVPDGRENRRFHVLVFGMRQIVIACFGVDEGHYKEGYYKAVRVALIQALIAGVRSPRERGHSRDPRL